MTGGTESWGGGRGAILRLAPPARLVCGALVGVLCSALPLESFWGVVLLAAVLAAWVVACGLPRRRLLMVARFTVCLFLPLAVLALALRLQAGAWHDATRVPLAVALRGMACVVACAATMAALELSEFGRALRAVRLPRAAVAVITQVAHQAALLTDESRRMAAALRVRGVLSSTVRTRLRCLCALPAAWLLRLLVKAERVGAAMEVRGFDGVLCCEPEASSCEAASGRDALVLQAVSVRYAADAPEALAEVSLRIGPGERVALLGLNGSGKTTLLLTVAGLLPFTGGIEVGGLPLARSTERQIRDRLGFLFGVPDDQLLFPNVMDDIAFSLERRGTSREAARKKAAAVMTRLGIGALAPCASHRLSQGQRQRVALAGALAADPPLLLLDEPSASLDPVGKEELAGLLETQAAAWLIATHDLEFARRVCRRFVILESGVVVDDTADPKGISRYAASRVADVRCSGAKKNARS